MNTYKKVNAYENQKQILNYFNYYSAKVIFSTLIANQRKLKSLWREMKVKVLVPQACLTLCDPMDCGPPGSSAQEFSRQECWSGLPFSSPGNLLDPGVKPASPALRAISFHLSHQGSNITQFLYNLLYIMSSIQLKITHHSRRKNEETDNGSGAIGNSGVII